MVNYSIHSLVYQHGVST